MQSYTIKIHQDWYEAIKNDIGPFFDIITWYIVWYHNKLCYNLDKSCHLGRTKTKTSIFLGGYSRPFWKWHLIRAKPIFMEHCATQSLIIHHILQFKWQRIRTEVLRVLNNHINHYTKELLIGAMCNNSPPWDLNSGPRILSKHVNHYTLPIIKNDPTWSTAIFTWIRNDRTWD